MAFYRIETYDEAVESYRRYPPDDLQGFTNLAIALIGTGRRAEALFHFRRAEAAAPERSMAPLHSRQSAV